MSYVVKSKIQEFAKKHEMNVGSDFYPELDKKIEELLKEASKRCTENKRKTLKAYDL
ncbi:MAG: NFYB/HAP3 family transcription factor subunit [Candidatus Thorarchaeota archaeon]|nr:NFYB/HAP3 family transcription factor subunit [Candidatus Thorarchaeota archaeon]